MIKHSIVLCMLNSMYSSQHWRCNPIIRFTMIFIFSPMLEWKIMMQSRYYRIMQTKTGVNWTKIVVTVTRKLNEKYYFYFKPLSIWKFWIKTKINFFHVPLFWNIFIGLLDFFWWVWKFHHTRKLYFSIIRREENWCMTLRLVRST